MPERLIGPGAAARRGALMLRSDRGEGAARRKGAYGGHDPEGYAHHRLGWATRPGLALLSA